MIPPMTKEEFLDGLTSKDLTFDNLYMVYLMGRIDGIMSAGIMTPKEKQDGSNSN